MEPEEPAETDVVSSSDSPVPDVVTSHENSYSTQQEIHSLLQGIHDTQNKYIKLLQEAWTLPSTFAEDAQVLYEEDWPANDTLLNSPGRDYLEKSLQPARLDPSEFEEKKLFNQELSASAVDILQQLKTWHGTAQEQWRRESGWFVRMGSDEQTTDRRTHYAVQLAIAQKEFRDPFEYLDNFIGSDIVQISEPSKDKNPYCGVIIQLGTDLCSKTLDFNTAVRIISALRLDAKMSINENVPKWSVISGAEFLACHIAKWEERLTLGYNAWSNLNPTSGSIRLQVSLVYPMRSFVLDSQAGDMDETVRSGSEAQGFTCSRQSVCLEPYYQGNSRIQLVEKRYTTAVSLLSFSPPAGHFVLASMCDGQQKEDIKFMLRDTPSGNFSTNTIENWKRYGIYPAGPYTGVSVFILQICACIDSWETDWHHTIRQIDECLSLGVSYTFSRFTEASLN